MNAAPPFTPADLLQSLGVSLLIADPATATLQTIMRRPQGGIELSALSVRGLGIIGRAAEGLVTVIGADIVLWGPRPPESDASDAEVTVPPASSMHLHLNRLNTWSPPKLPIAMSGDRFGLWAALPAIGLCRLGAMGQIDVALPANPDEAVTAMYVFRGLPEVLCTQVAAKHPLDLADNRLSIRSLNITLFERGQLACPHWHRNRLWWLEADQRALCVGLLLADSLQADLVVQFEARPLSLAVHEGVAFVLLATGESTGIAMVNLENGQLLAQLALPVALPDQAQLIVLPAPRITWSL